jgi:uncharacterized membrane protein HdeD (DUF308 family)
MSRLLSQSAKTLLVRGIVYLLFGVLALVLPNLTVRLLVVLFGVFAIVGGIASLAMGLTGRGELNAWRLLVAEGVIGLVLGILVLAFPSFTEALLVILIGVWAIFSGVFEIGDAIRLRREIEGEWALGLMGLLSLILGVLFVVMPGAGLIALVWVLGTYAILLAVLLFYLSFEIRRLGRNMETRPRD